MKKKRIHHQVNPQNQMRQQMKIKWKRLKENKPLYITSISIICILVVSAVTLLGFNITHSSILTSELLKDKEVDNLVFSNADLNGNKLSVEVKNNNDEVYTLNTIDVVFKDESGSEITTLSGYIGNSLNKDDVKRLVVETDEDLSNSYSIEYKINK